MIMHSHSFSDDLSHLANMERKLASALREFEKAFPTEEICVEELWKRLEKLKQICPQCRGKNLLRTFGSRKAQCQHCKKPIWLTADTFFERARTLRPWFLAIWLIERRLAFNSVQLQKWTNLVYSSARNIFLKVNMMLQTAVSENPIEVPSAEFRALMTRRSRNTIAKLRPQSEEDTLEAQRKDSDSKHESSDSSTKHQVPDFSQSSLQNKSDTETKAVTQVLSDFPEHLGENERKILELIADSELSSDQIVARTGIDPGKVSSCLLLLFLDGLIDQSNNNLYKRKLENRPLAHCSSTPVPEVDIQGIANATSFIRTIFQGVSRKYLQVYLAFHRFVGQRKRHKRLSLLQHCLRSNPISERAILLYETPLYVKLIKLSAKAQL